MTELKSRTIKDVKLDKNRPRWSNKRKADGFSLMTDEEIKNLYDKHYDGKKK